VEIVTGKLKSYSYKSPAELIKAGGEIYSDIHRLVCSIRNKEELPQQWKEPITISYSYTLTLIQTIIFPILN